MRTECWGNHFFFSYSSNHSFCKFSQFLQIPAIFANSCVAWNDINIPHIPSHFLKNMVHNQGFLPTTVTKNCIFLEGLEDYFHLLAMKCSNILHYLPLRMLRGCSKKTFWPAAWKPKHSHLTHTMYSWWPYYSAYLHFHMMIFYFVF